MSVKKMALVPHNMVERLMEAQRHQSQLLTDSPIQQLFDLDEHMKSILNSKQPAEMKAKQYSQALHRYSTMRSNEIHPQTRVEEEPKPKGSLLRGLPKRYLSKAEVLLSHLEDNKAFTWDDQNEMSYKGVPIQGSNVIDLIHSFVKPTVRQKPTGWQDFSKALVETHVPRIALGNRNLPLVELDSSTLSKASTTFDTPPAITPAAKRRREPTASPASQLATPAPRRSKRQRQQRQPNWEFSDYE